MTDFDHRLQEVAQYFSNNDWHLGYRRLLDAAIETQNFAVYQRTLQFCDWYDSTLQHEPSLLNQQVQDLLQAIRNGYKETAVRIGQPALSAEGISKTYAQGRFKLSSMDVRLQSGSIIGLVGENGNGKTTLLRVLNGELQHDTGNIQYHFAPAGSDGYDVKSRLAFIPQRPQTWYGLLMDNLQYASSFAGYKGKENFLWTEMIIARMGLRPFRTYSWSRISSGYKMRFELARTLIRRPEVLLLDEPLANLDMLAQQIILEDLRFLAQSHTMPLSIILSSQQLYEVEKVSDQVIFLQKGVARYQQTSTETAVPTGLTIELETTASREALQAALQALPTAKISFNGGVYLLYFDAAVSFPQVMTALGNAALPVKYLRDITTSSRRFFDA
jgi:ABC-2 type transport system ATP-binding protein